MKKYKKGATEEYGSREKWGQFYKIVPVTLADAVKAEK